VATPVPAAPTPPLVSEYVSTTMLLAQLLPQCPVLESLSVYGVPLPPLLILGPVRQSLVCSFCPAP
jgi:hypothetical protein